MPITDGASAHGFTLIEVLVALALTSLFLVLLLPISVSTLRRAEFSASKNRAWLLAKSQLANNAVCARPATGLIKGREAALAWQLAISDGGSQTGNVGNPGSAVSLRTVRMTVTEGGAGAPLVDVSVQRLCLAP